MFATDILPALTNISKTLTGITVPHCTAANPTSHACYLGHADRVNGITVLANATRALVDPNLAKTRRPRRPSGEHRDVAPQRRDARTPR